ncbi:MAG: hypothetical protein AAF628_29535 [Planctomycetota bacterium]
MTRLAEALGVITLVGGALALYLGWMQWTGCFDGPSLLMQLRHGVWDRVTANFLYLPLAGTWSELLAGLDVPQYEATAAFSAVATCGGLVLLHLAGRRFGLPWRSALGATVLTALCPAIVFFGTVVEIHGPFTLFAGLSLWATARLCARVTPARAALAGASSGLAYLMHASGIALPVLMVGLLWAVPRSASRAQRLRAASALSAMHLVWVALGPTAIGSLLGCRWSTAGAFAVFGEYAAEALEHPEWLLGSVWREWLWPFAPLSVAWLTAFAAPGLRPLAGAFAVALVLYGAMAFLALRRIDGHGAYLLPLAWPAAWLAVLTVPRGVLWGLALLSVALAASGIALHDRPERSQSYAAGVRQLAAGRPVTLLMADYFDREACAIALPEVEPVSVPSFVGFGAGPLLAGLPRLTETFRARLGRGERILLSAAAEATLQEYRDAATLPAAGVFLDYLHREFEVSAVRAVGFRGFILREP